MRHNSIESLFIRIRISDFIIIATRTLAPNAIPAETQRTMRSASDSPVPISPHSPSSLSEPLDIKNWCPSYEYESFVLDTYDEDLQGCVFGESGSDFNGCGVDKDSVRGKERYLGVSVQLEKEPPHIRNWFPIYLYESPSLNTIDDYKETNVNKTKCEGETKGETEERIRVQRTSGNSNEASASLHLDGLVAEKSLLGDGCKSKPLNKTSETYQSLLSEPLDLRNWFSSYVYESPELGESHELFHKETECQEEDLLNDVSILSTTVLKHDKEDSQPIYEGNREVRKVIISGGINSCKLSHAELRQNGMYKTQSSLNEEALPRKPEACLPSIKSNKKTSAINSKPPKIFIHGNDLQEDLEDGVKAETCDLGSPEALKKMDGSFDDKENQSKFVTSNGFVTMRKSSKSTSENPLNTCCEVFRECTKSNRKTMLNGASNVIGKRQALSERTNLECCEAMGITGKWHCPQKNKPNVGPPLKQLRLERWVHRT